MKSPNDTSGAMSRREKLTAIANELLGLVRRAHKAADEENFNQAEGLLDDIAHVAATTNREATTDEPDERK